MTVKKMEKDGILTSLRKGEGGRSRKYYYLTDEGKKLFNHMSGFFYKLLESLSPILNFQLNLLEEEYIFCPNCTNRIEPDEQIKYCEVCGIYVREHIIGEKE